MSPTKWRQFCLAFIVHITVIIFCISSEIRLNASRYNSRVVWKGAQMAQCPVAFSHQAITWTKFCKSQQVIHIIRPKICIPQPMHWRYSNLAPSHCPNTGKLDIISASLHSFVTRDLTGWSLLQASTFWSRVPHIFVRGILWRWN